MSDDLNVRIRVHGPDCQHCKELWQSLSAEDLAELDWALSEIREGVTGTSFRLGGVLFRQAESLSFREFVRGQYCATNRKARAAALDKVRRAHERLRS